MFYFHFTTLFINFISSIAILKLVLYSYFKNYILPNTNRNPCVPISIRCSNLTPSDLEPRYREVKDHCVSSFTSWFHSYSNTLCRETFTTKYVIYCAHCISFYFVLSALLLLWCDFFVPGQIGLIICRNAWILDWSRIHLRIFTCLFI